MFQFSPSPRIQQKRLADTKSILLSKSKAVIKATSGVVFKQKVSEMVEARRKASIAKAVAAAKLAAEEAVAAARPAGLLGRLFV